MNEQEFKLKWKSEKLLYSAWGTFIVESISQSLLAQGKDLNTFLKIPAKYRLKEENSLIDKAFYRDKDYSDPYSQIEDKVGVRFIVLLLDDIENICNIIRSSNEWEFDACKHFEEDKNNEPLLFTYQSVHFVLRPKHDITIGDIVVPKSTPCEVQVRTLLQHAHAELTHDAIYKAKKAIKPEVHRNVAKSMALIETTDSIFTQVTQTLNKGPLQELGIINRLDGIYLSMTGLTPHNQKSSLVIWDAFEQLIDDKLIDNIQNFLKKNAYISELIKENYTDSTLYQQSTVLFIYWLLKKKRTRLLADWPLSKRALDPFANDLVISLWDE
jgi:ppGpp synthetase/RelA/SpoT-type nucleotidyltranferase